MLETSIVRALKSTYLSFRALLKAYYELISLHVQIFFYFLGWTWLLVLLNLPIFQQSVDAELYVWLLKEQKKRKASTVQEVIRQILREARAVNNNSFFLLMLSLEN